MSNTKVDWSVVDLRIDRGFGGTAGALWAKVVVQVSDESLKQPFHTLVTFELPLWPDGSASLDQLCEQALASAKAALTAPEKLVPIEPTEWRAPGEAHALPLDLPSQQSGSD